MQPDLESKQRWVKKNNRQKDLPQAQLSQTKRENEGSIFF
jgi:hypothetical protein